MAGKPNIRSIRFSDELAELIDRQAGNTFTEKFENLVTRCVWELPQREEELEKVQKQVRQEEKRLAGELSRVNGMLSNEKFLSKAPEAKIAEERAKLQKYTQMMEQVKERLAQLQK